MPEVIYSGNPQGLNKPAEMNEKGCEWSQLMMENLSIHLLN